MFHQAYETGGLHIQEAGDQINSVPRRYVDNVKEQRGSQETLGYRSWAANSPGIHYQFEVEYPFPDSGNRIPRVPLEFSQNDNCISATQVTLPE